MIWKKRIVVFQRLIAVDVFVVKRLSHNIASHIHHFYDRLEQHYKSENDITNQNSETLRDPK